MDELDISRGTADILSNIQKHSLAVSILKTSEAIPEEAVIVAATSEETFQDYQHHENFTEDTLAGIQGDPKELQI